jgi:hypothetical protein
VRQKKTYLCVMQVSENIAQDKNQEGDEKGGFPPF